MITSSIDKLKFRRSVTKRRIKHSIAVLCAMFLVVGFSLVAFAASPRIVSASASVDNAGTLTGTFTETGLASNQTITYAASGTETAAYSCSNGTKPKVVGPVSNTITLISSGTGRVAFLLQM